MNPVILEHNVVSIYSENTKKKIDWNEVNQNIKWLFQEDCAFWKYKSSIDTVLIEKQPPFGINNCMLSSSLFTFFYQQFAKVLFVPPIRRKGSYTERKKKAIHEMKFLIENDMVTHASNINMDYFNDKKKLDDLADSLLLGYNFLN